MAARIAICIESSNIRKPAKKRIAGSHVKDRRASNARSSLTEPCPDDRLSKLSLPRGQGTRRIAVRKLDKTKTSRHQSLFVSEVVFLMTSNRPRSVY